MRIVKAFLFLGGGLFLALTLIGLLIPSKIVISKSVTIAATAAEVLAPVADLREWRHWHPVMKDSVIISAEVDQIIWKTAKHENRITVTKREAGVLTLALTRDGELPVDNIISVDSAGGTDGTTVVWTSVTHLRWYPWEKFGGLFIEKMSGDGYAAALKSLKDHVEAIRAVN